LSQVKRRWIATRAVWAAGRSLRGRERGGYRVVRVFHYGAVDIAPELLVVWIMLGGRPADEIPAWFAVRPGLEPADRPPHIDYEWLLELRAVVADALVSRGWEIANPDVMVDSDERVTAIGFHDYFQ
jgi:hypothetical protein